MPAAAPTPGARGLGAARASAIWMGWCAETMTTREWFYVALVSFSCKLSTKSSSSIWGFQRKMWRGGKVPVDLQLDLPLSVLRHLGQGRMPSQTLLSGMDCFRILPSPGNPILTGVLVPCWRGACALMIFLSHPGTCFASPPTGGTVCLRS